MRLLPILLAALPAVASAAPFDCTRALPNDGPRVEYNVDRSDLIADVRVSNDFDGLPGCFFSAEGQIDTVAGTGLLTFDNGEQYGVTLLGDLGSEFFFDESLAGFDFSAGFSEVPPAHRLIFEPLGGRDLGLTYPVGFSIAFDRAADLDGDFGPFFLLGGNGRLPDFAASDGGGPYFFAPVPLPATLPLGAGALVLLGWIARRRTFDAGANPAVGAASGPEPRGV